MHSRAIKLQSAEEKKIEINACLIEKKAYIHRFRGRPQVPLKHSPACPPDDSGPVSLRKCTDQVYAVVPAIVGCSVHSECLI